MIRFDRLPKGGAQKLFAKLGAPAALIIAVLPASASAQPGPRDLQLAVKAYDVAQVAGDRAALERLLAPDYVLINSRGKSESKAQFIADLVSPGFKLEPFTVDEPLRRIWPGGAVFGGVTTLKGVSDGHPYQARLRFSDVWARRHGRWQVIHTLVAPVPNP